MAIKMLRKKFVCLQFAHGTTEERDGSILKFLGEQFFEKFECLRSLMSDIFNTCHAQSVSIYRLFIKLKNK